MRFSLEPSMSVSRTLRASIGKKWLMAISGFGLLGFVIAHMLGNLQVFLGRQKLNDYAESIQHMGLLLWIARAGLLVLLVIHVATAFKLSSENRAARPVGYLGMKPQVTTYAARTMWMTGLIVLAFIAYHLAHFTFGLTDAAAYAHHETIYVTSGPSEALGSHQRHDVYAMVVGGFQNVVVVALYVIAQALLALHISHGASSALQTVGVTHPAMEVVKGSLGKLLAVAIFVGNCSIPLAILFGLVK
jgi:succinate dehydrogenase / fumarate reductase cytochrome b subunit